MKLLLLCCVLLILGNLSIAKRGGGSRGGGSRSKSSGSGSWWSTRKSSKSSSSGSVPASTHTQVQPPKPSAPKPETKTNAHVQQSANPNSKQPIGWNVPGTNKNTQGRLNNTPKNLKSYTNIFTNRKNKPTQSSSIKNIFNRKNIIRNPARNNPKSASRVSPGIQQSHAYGTNSQPHNPWGTQQQGTWGNHQSGAWGNQRPGTYGSQPGWGNQHPGGWGNQQSGGWGNQHAGGWGNTPGGYGGYNQHGHSGFGGGGMHGGYGGYGGGFGGAGAMGMAGGYGGMGGYGMQKKSGFFSGSTFGNIVTGMAIYHVTSSLARGIFGVGHQSRPYTVNNYYNQPPEAREEIKLPSNMLSVCEGSLTDACTGATAICTTNNTVLCVVTMAQATPCEKEKAMCVNTTIPCVDKSEPICQNTTQEQTQTVVNLPCYTNLSIDVNLLNEAAGVKNGDDYQYCVTTMAVAGPEYQECSKESVLEKYNYRNVLAGNLSYNLTIWPMMRKYQVYNQENPLPTSSGELVLPLDVLITCIDNATTLCPPDLVTICTGFAEIMCIKPITSTNDCEDYNTTCYKSEIPCEEVIEDDFLCQNKTIEELIVKDDKKFVAIDMPCIANITINTNLPNFDIQTFNGTLPRNAPSSFMYHYHFCLITMSIPGPETDMCIIPEADKKI